MSTENKNGLLDGFDWENENDFFPIEGEVKLDSPKPIPVEDEEEDEDLETKSKPGPKPKKKEEEEDDDFFEAPKPTKVGELVASPNPGETTESVYTSLLKDSKETGLFRHVEIEEDEDIDAERFAELQELEYETEVSERLKTWATEELDEDARAFIKFKREGGNTEDFFKTYQSSLDLPTGNIDDEDYQDRLIRYQLTKEGWDKDEIEDRLQYLTETNRKEKTAKKYDEKVKEEDLLSKKELLKQAEAQKQQVRVQEETFKSTIKDYLQETDEIEGFKINQKDKVEIFNFLTKKEHKVSDNRSITGFQKKLAEVFQDTNKMVLLAKLISNDFDMSDFEKKVTTKNTRNIKSNLEQRKNLRPSNSGSSLQGASLSEFFN